MTDADYVAAFQKIVMPIAYEFRPDFVLGEAMSIFLGSIIYAYSKSLFRQFLLGLMPRKVTSLVAVMFRPADTHK